MARKPTPARVIRIIVEKHDDGYVAYPLGLRGAVVGQGDSYEAALGDVQSAIAFHIDTFGDSAFADVALVKEAFVAEYRLARAPGR